MTSRTRPRTLAARLLEEVASKSDSDAHTLAGALDLSVGQFEAYRSGETRMSVEHQLKLATFVISRTPACARTARRLISQANAEAAFLGRETTTHMSAPPSRFWR